MRQSDEKVLEHYGVLGMKWGVRKDRSSGRSVSKEAKTLSDSELKARVNRMNMERQYVDLVRQRKEQERSTLEKGAREVGKILLNSGKQALQQYTTKAANDALTKTIKAGTGYEPPKKKK